MLRHMLLPAIAALCLPGLALAAPVSVKSIGDTCLESEVQKCTVAAAGFVASEGVPRLAYQIQRGVDEYDGTIGGVVVLTEIDGEWTALDSDFSGVWYQLPRLTEIDSILFHIPGFTAGSGSYNADLLFQYDPDASAWKRIDIDSWGNDLDGKLPDGLEIWKGVGYDFGSMSWGQMIARTSLWKEDDANCCPSGGEAVIHFEIKDGALAVTTVDYEEPKSD